MRAYCCVRLRNYADGYFKTVHLCACLTQTANRREMVSLVLKKNLMVERHYWLLILIMAALMKLWVFLALKYACTRAVIGIFVLRFIRTVNSTKENLTLQLVIWMVTDITKSLQSTFQGGLKCGCF